MLQTPQNQSLQQQKTLRQQSIYLLPNLFTTAALFGGFYAIVQAMNGKFEHAAVAIFISMVLDGLDGRVARLTHTQSAFGAEYDSLSDMVSFGVAPALVSYVWMLRDLGKLGWMVAFIYAVGAALRLARFNTMLEVQDKRYFQGLPSPAAAALVAGLVWICVENNISGPFLPWLTLGFTLFAGITMVSNIRYYSFKEFNARKSVPFVALLIIVLMIVLISSNSAIGLFGIFVALVMSGYVMWLIGLRRKKLTPTDSDSTKKIDI